MTDDLLTAAVIGGAAFLALQWVVIRTAVRAAIMDAHFARRRDLDREDDVNA